MDESHQKYLIRGAILLVLVAIVVTVSLVQKSETNQIVGNSIANVYEQPVYDAKGIKVGKVVWDAKYADQYINVDRSKSVNVVSSGNGFVASIEGGVNSGTMIEGGVN
jgi:hypothetical protein